MLPYPHPQCVSCCAGLEFIIFPREKNALVLLIVTHPISVKTIFVYTITGKKYYLRYNFTCSSINIIYMEECINYKSRYIGSTTSFKQHLCIHE